MRFLFSKLKLKYIGLIFIVTICIQFLFGIIANIILEFPLDKSPNPKATEYFVNAMKYRFYVSKLHNFVDYDNPIMKPLLNQLNEEYEKGKSLLPKESSEDVYWYVILFRGIYGIGGIPDDRDMSISFEKNLKTKEDFIKHYEEILNKIRRLSTNDFNYAVPRITQYKFEVMSNLASEIISSFYEIVMKDKSVLNDVEYLKDLYDVNSYFKEYSEKHLPLANKQNENEIENKYLEIILFTYYEYTKKIITNTINCSDKEYLILFKNIKEFKHMEKYKVRNSYRLDYIFNEYTNLYNLLNDLKNCSKLKEETTEVLQYFNPEFNKPKTVN